MITFRQDFQIMKEKLTNITAALFNEMSDNVENALTNLNSKIESTIDSIRAKGTWNDNVSVEINGGVRAGLKNVIESCKSPACQLIESIGINSESLYMKLKEYIAKFEEYKQLLKDKENLVNNEPPKTIYNSRTKEEESNSEWSAWKEKLNLLEFAIQAMETAIQGIEAMSDSLINTLKSLLGPITSSSIAALSSSAASMTEEIIDNDVKKVSVQTVNKDGTITESYTLYDQSGNEIGVGNIKYDQMGNKLIEEYSKILSDGSRKNATITYDGNKANEVSSIVNKDGTVISNTDSFVDNKTKIEVQKVVEETKENTETKVEVPITETTTQKVSMTSGLTEKEVAFVNDNSHDNKTLRLMYNGEEISDNSKITIKEGQTVEILVKIPTNYGEQIDLCRASTGGDDSYKSGGLKQSNSVSPNRYSKSDILKDTGYYVWTITGEKSGSYIISQTAQFNTERQQYYNQEQGNGAFKEMCRLYIEVK